MDFKNLNLDVKYKSEKESNKILNNFYLPVLGQSKLYYRAVGYFSSSILLDYIKSLEIFIRNNGRIRLIISPAIKEDDFEALRKIVQNEEDFIYYLNNLLFKNSSFNYEIDKASDLFAALIYKGFLEVKIAIPKNEFGIFHEKIGIFEDFNGNRIAITGSNNETYNALNYNYESFNVFCDWKLGQKIYVDRHLDDFESYWEQRNCDILVFDVDEKLLSKIKPMKLDDIDIQSSYDEISKPSMTLEVKEVDNTFSGIFKPYKHQEDAVKLLMEHHKGILKFATGSGKTKTAVLFLYEYFKIKRKSFVIIVVPDKTLVRQWDEELNMFFENVVACDSDHKNWYIQIKNYVQFYGLSKIIDNFIIVSTINTFSTSRFQEEIQKLNNDYIFISDECHVFGTENNLSLLPDTDFRIGLSATPEIHFNKDLTERLFSYFNGILLEYSLADAIRENKLVGYEYFPIILNLNIDEKLKYEEITLQIVKILGKDDESEFNQKLSEKLSMLLFKRSRIVYSAQSKLEYLGKNISLISERKNLLIYCGITSEKENDIGKNQITSVNEILRKKGISFAQYTENENGEVRTENIGFFKDGTFSTLVAIKCLDQGVDIPEIERAIIMSSSTNPREFIQRRGRLLRKNGDKKKRAEIIDLVVIEDDRGFKSMNKNELIRVKEFAELAINRDAIFREFEGMFNKYIESEQK